MGGSDGKRTKTGTLYFMYFSTAIICVISLIVIVNIQSFNYNLQYKTVEHSGFITNKWSIQENSFLVFGIKTVYKIEVDNSSVFEVSDQYFYNHNIGDSYSWTEVEEKTQAEKEEWLDEHDNIWKILAGR